MNRFKITEAETENSGNIKQEKSMSFIQIIFFLLHCLDETAPQNMQFSTGMSKEWNPQQQSCSIADFLARRQPQY